MNTFENDLSLYPEFDEATEGFKDVVQNVGHAIGSAASAVWNAIKAFGAWIAKQMQKLIEWGKALKRDKLINPEADAKAHNLSIRISNDISILAQDMDSILTDIAKARETANPYDKNNSDETIKNSNAEITKGYEKMNTALKKSGEIASELKQLPKMKMSYSTCGAIYNNMKRISDENSNMYKVASSIRSGMESGRLDSKQKALTRFLNLYGKLRKCTEALLAKFYGMSSSDSAVKQKVDDINESNKKQPNDKKVNPIDSVNPEDVASDVKASAGNTVSSIAKKLSDPKFTKINNGNPINANEWINYVVDKAKHDAEDNPKNKSKQLIAQRLSNKQQMLLYVLSVTNVSNVKKWIKNKSAIGTKSNESADDSAFNDIIYNNIKEGILEDAYLETEEEVDAAFEGLEIDDDFDFLTDSESE